MADCLKNIRKKTVRVKESVLESLGKADRTLDNDYVDVKNDFLRQQKSGYQLRNDLRSYLVSMRAANQALRNFHDTVNLMYEPELRSSEKLKYLMQDSEASWDSYLNRGEKAFQEVVQYCSPFPQIRTKISKRHRKLVDYDSARHSYDSAMNSPRKTEDSVKKASDQLYSARKLYDDLNNGLLHELPPLYDARLPLILKVCRQVFDDNARFHCHSSKINKDLADVVAADESKFKINPPTRKAIIRNNIHDTDGRTTIHSHNGVQIYDAAELANDRGYGTLDKCDQNTQRQSERIVAHDLKAYDSGLCEDSGFVESSAAHGLNKFRVVHKYIPVNTAEIPLELGQMIDILPYDGHADEGWAYGSINGTELIGLFPLIFTKPVD